MPKVKRGRTAGKAGARTKKQPAAAPRSKKAVSSGKKPASKAPPRKLEPVRGVKIRELDPQAKCGPATSVQRLFRVDETLGSQRTTHLVFLDKHGWYCEHGRTCRAVTDVHRQGRRKVG